MKKTNLVIFCYNRVNHIKVLLKNIKYLTNRKIYIVCDGLKNNEEDYKSVKLVRNLITNIGFDIKTGENPNKLKNLHKFNLNFPLIHPNIENRYTKYDDYCARNIYSLPKFIWRLKKKFSKLFIFKKIIF